MKKILFSIFLLMFLCFPIKSKAIVTNSSYSIKVNFFYENNCKECDQAKEWLEENKKDSYINIEYIDIEENKDLYDNVKKSLNIKKNKMPLIIIGSNYYFGFNDNITSNVEEALNHYEDAGKYCDLVNKIQNEEDTKDCIKQNKKIYKQSTNITFKIIFIIIGICLIVGVGLIINKKKILSRLHK